MQLGFDTIGNATLICYDSKPLLCTDPWITGSAYFGSWAMSHAIPEEQQQAIRTCPYVWFSHGHPDHLNTESLPCFRGKKIFLADHVGHRIHDWLQHEGYDVHVLEDRQWVSLSNNVRVMCIADYNQDSILLLDINGRLVINANDASEIYGWGRKVRRLITSYRTSILLALSGFNDADMINFFDDEGHYVPSIPTPRLPVGEKIQRRLAYLGADMFIPFSSMHRYQRADSIWANQYITTLADYDVGFTSATQKLLPAFIRYNCLDDTYQEIRPAETPAVTLDPELFGDNWSEPLERSDVSNITAYFRAIAALSKYLDFLNVRVGGVDNIIELRRKKFHRGITFECPRHSLMQAITYETFDDLLIGNFMKTTLHGTWPASKLYPYFTPFVAKYADNGRAKSPEDLQRYVASYRRRAPLDFLYHWAELKTKDLVMTYIPPEASAYKVAKRTYWTVKKLLP